MLIDLGQDLLRLVGNSNRLVVGDDTGQISDAFVDHDSGVDGVAANSGDGHWSLFVDYGR